MLVTETRHKTMQISAYLPFTSDKQISPLVPGFQHPVSCMGFLQDESDTEHSSRPVSRPPKHKSKLAHGSCHNTLHSKHNPVKVVQNNNISTFTFPLLTTDQKHFLHKIVDRH